MFRKKKDKDKDLDTPADLRLKELYVLLSVCGQTNMTLL